MGTQTEGNGRPGTIEQLIKVTEDRVRAEERVGALLREIKAGQEQQVSQLMRLSAQVDTFSRCVSGLQQMLTVVAEYMAVLAGKDGQQVRDITESLLQRSGVSFGTGTKVDIGGDMVGGDKKGKEE